MESTKSFSVKFKFVDKHQDHSVKEVFFETEALNGSLNRQHNYDNFHIFKMGIGPHKIALQIISLEESSQLMLTHKKFSCLSFRNFTTIN